MSTADRGTRTGAGRAGPEAEEAVDPDVDLHVLAHRGELAGPRRTGTVLAAIAAGGALGALARYAVTLALPADPQGFPWPTWSVNVVGCLLIGVLMVLVSEGGRGAHAHPLARPFLGVGVLGGFTTFSTYAVEVARLLDQGPGNVGVTAAYLLGTVLAALLAVWAGTACTRWVVRTR
ncbi:fluoride efflux transporter CrcB [Streptomyces sp. ODS28]|uniref:fluoride efflux transporter CrcB n=1 Tax=Streptomyces sp. ODS28 TaxID=3136688 RepID=UPI0031EAE437